MERKICKRKLILEQLKLGLIAAVIYIIFIASKLGPNVQIPVLFVWEDSQLLSLLPSPCPFPRFHILFRLRLFLLSITITMTILMMKIATTVMMTILWVDSSFLMITTLPMNFLRKILISLLLLLLLPLRILLSL